MSRAASAPASRRGAEGGAPADPCYFDEAPQERRPLIDYYDPHPTAALARPLALVGCYGAGAPQVAYALCARSGLPFVDLDRMIEHAAGSSLGALFVRSGAERYHELARAALDQGLRRRPHPVVALGPEALRDRTIRRRVAAEATLVYLRGEPDELARRARAQLAEQPTRFFPFLADAAAATIERLGALLDERREGYEEATIVLELAGAHPHTLAEALVTRLGL